MNYIEESKSEGEDILEYFNVNKWVYLPIYFEIIAGILLFIVSIYIVESIDFEEIKFISQNEAFKLFKIVSFVIIAKGFYDFLLIRSLNMGITTKRIAFKKGIVSRKTNEIRLEAVETVDVEQSILARMFGFGTVNITGKGDSIIKFKGIDDPVRIKRDIASVLNKYGSK